jgi:hypothetical protein
LEIPSHFAKALSDSPSWVCFMKSSLRKLAINSLLLTLLLRHLLTKSVGSDKKLCFWREFEAKLMVGVVGFEPTTT